MLFLQFKCEFPSFIQYSPELASQCNATNFKSTCSVRLDRAVRTRTVSSLVSRCSTVSDAFLFLDADVERPIDCCLGGLIDLTTKF